MEIKEFEDLMEKTPCCNHGNVLNAINAQDPSNEDLLDHMAFVMADELFANERIFFLPLVAQLYKNMRG